ncbi:CaiB/BaiF CoA transferase family protein [Methylobacterium platani]|uniref:Acetyl-CoA acetyltransferase n=1 Tax=Methylobacterium platani JCM 14648 TaxID=1295136 RepID=A0ABR5H6G8_9HYPH|nr:CoA transferase [Methylobacterium platani]KMO19916.1 acetyl-CoA acetyltransferase [Methylobacterium platani JCM 14648]
MAGALAGLRVLDLTNTLMGPYATQLLADMGADVIKVEPPGGDPVRGLGPFRNPGMGAIFLQVNRGKRSLVLDLKQEAGRDALLRLATTADLLVYNMRPKVMERLGLGYADLSAVRPDIVYAGLFGFGQDGPHAGRPAYDDLIQGASALPSLAVQAGATAPRYVPLALVDRVVGLYGVGAITAALWHRERTGEGQRLDIPMFETMASFVLADHMGGRLFDPPIAPPGYARLLSKDRRPYATRDGYVCALIYNDGQWQRFFAAVGRPEVWRDDPPFRTISERTRHIDAIYGLVAEILAGFSTEESVALLERADIPVSRLATLASLIDDPHLAAKGFFVAIDHPSEGRLTMPGIPGRFSATPPAIGRPAPRLGADSRAVLEEAGLSAPEIAAMAEAGVTLSAP